MKQLGSDLSEGFLFHASECGIFNISVEVDLQKFKDDEKIRPELEAVDHFNDAMAVGVFAQDLLQNFDFNLSVDYVSVSIARNLDRHIDAFVFHVFAFQNLAECANVNQLFDYIPEADLFPWSSGILAVRAVYLIS